MQTSVSDFKKTENEKEPDLYRRLYIPNLSILLRQLMMLVAMDIFDIINLF